MATKQAISPKNVGAQAAKPKPIVKFDENLFVQGLVGALKTNSNITDDSPLDDLNAAVQEVTELWLIEKDYKEHGGYDTAIEAIQDITRYIVDNAYVYEKPVLFRVDSFTVNLSVPTKVPGVTASFSYQCTALDVDLSACMLSAFSELQSFASDNFKPKANTPQPTQQGAFDKPADEPFEFATLRSLLFNGKMQARLMPLEGKWVQFGIPLYPDEARKAGINLDDYVTPGDYELQGSAIVSHKTDGKPMRAHKLELA